MGKNIWKAIAPIAGAILGSTILPGVGLGISGLGGASIGSGVGTLASGGSPANALLSAGGSYLGGNLLGNSNFVPGDSIGSSVNSALGATAANALPSGIAGSSLSSALGSTLGSNLAVSTLGTPDKIKSPAGPPGFSPSQQPAMTLPSDLSSLSGLNPMQQSTNIANHGVYGGGAGSADNQYFLNLINNRLVDPNGQVGDQNSLQPIEQSYLAQLGLGGYKNPTDLLKGISQYKGA